MKLVAPILFLCINAIGYTQIRHNAEAKAFTHLEEVNEQWASNKEQAPKEQRSFVTDIERIHFHLTLVEKVLRKRNSNHLTQSQQVLRSALLDTLSGYANKRIFPTNTEHRKRTPYFIDDFSVYCAVGYLMQQSGYDGLALKIDEEHHNDYIGDIKTNGVSEWAENHGFTLDELAWIQPTYEFMNNPGHQSLGGGTNGTVKRIAMDEKRNRIFIIGDFDTLNVTGSCSQFAYYEGSHLQCVDANFKGNLTDLVVVNGKAFVTGQMDNNGKNYSLAIFENDSLKYLNVPGREGYMSSTISPSIENNAFELVIENKTSSEIWRYDGNWMHIATVEGKINSIARGGEYIVYAGAFNNFTAHQPEQEIELLANNVVQRSLTDGKWFALQGQIAKEVLKVKWRENSFFFAGRDSEERAFSMLYEESIIALGSPWCFADARAKSNEVTIHDFELSGDSIFTIVGDFYVGLQYETYNHATFTYRGFRKKLSNSKDPLFVEVLGTMTYETQEIPHCILIHANIIYTGGKIERMGNIQYIDRYRPGFQVRKARLYEVRPAITADGLTFQGSPVKNVKIYDSNWNYIKKGRRRPIKLENCPSGKCYAELELEYGNHITVSFWNTKE